MPVKRSISLPEYIDDLVMSKKPANVSISTWVQELLVRGLTSKMSEQEPINPNVFKGQASSARNSGDMVYPGYPLVTNSALVCVGC